MKTKQLIAMLVVAIGIASCGKKIQDLPMAPTSTEVLGDLSDYLEILPGDYKLNPSTQYGKAFESKVKLKVRKAMPELSTVKRLDHLSMDILDESGMPVTGLDKLKFDGYTSFDDANSLESMLIKGSGEILATFYMEKPYRYDESIANENAEKIKKFSVSSVLGADDKTSSSKSSETSSLEDNSSDSEDWDKMITEYDSYMAQYIKMMKKANSGDMGAMAEYPALLEKANSFAEKLKDAENSGASPKQIAKFAAVQAKYNQQMMTIMSK